jgi:predicted DNA-binding antitoxin AbrB/MazE fold protein
MGENPMIQIIIATFEDGVLKPDTMLDLPAGARVRLYMDSEPASEAMQDDAFTEWERLCDESPIHSIEPHLTRDQLHERC